MKYEETKSFLDKIRSNVGEILFRTGISHLMDVGIRNLTEENVKQACEEIALEDDSKSAMSNNFKQDILKVAGEIAKFDHIHLLIYIQQEMIYDANQKEIAYPRLLQLLEKCMDWMSEYGTYETSILKDAFLIDCGFEEEEIKQLGFGYVL